MGEEVPLSFLTILVEESREEEQGESTLSSCATNPKLIFLHVPYELTIFQSFRGQLSLTTLVCKGDGWI